jgi:hypothetical protein
MSETGQQGREQSTSELASHDAMMMTAQVVGKPEASLCNNEIH